MPHTPRSSPDAPAPDAEAADTPRLGRWPLLPMAWVLSVVSTLVVPLLHLNHSSALETATASLFALLSWAGLLAAHRGHHRHLPWLLVCTVQLVAVLAVLSFGSVRTAGGFMFVGAVAAAGILLGRRALAATVLSGVLALGLLTWIENLGWLRVPDMGVGLKGWLVQSATLVCVAILVYHSRTLAEQAMARAQAELRQRQETEQERDRSQERFARIFRNSPIPMLAQSARTGSILDVNPAFERCCGFSRDQVLGRVDTFLWADPQQRLPYLNRLRERRQVQLAAVKAVRADGSHFDAQIASEMADDLEDRLVITTLIDVTRQQAALEQLKRSEERFAKAFNFSPLNMAITRLSDGTILEINQAHDRAHGGLHAQWLGRPSVEAGIWPSAAERGRFVQQLRQAGRLEGYETRMRHRDGSLVDAKLWAVLIDIDGEPCVLACLLNVTEEKRRQALLEEVAQGVAGAGGADGSAFFGSLALHLGQAIGADRVKLDEQRPDGRHQPLAHWPPGALPSVAGHTQTWPLSDADGSVIGHINVNWQHPSRVPPDTQELLTIFASRAQAELLRLRREREIQHLNETLEQRVQLRTAELEKLNAELDTFAYSVSHDLKLPLRAINGFTQLLHEQLQARLEPAQAQLFARLLGATQRMGTLIDDLLTLARISQGPLNRTRVDLSALALELLQQARQRHPGSPLRWQIEPGLLCDCDPRLTRIALDGLLDNAVKYSRHQPEPLVAFGQAPSGDFFVRDNGAGFDMAHADRLFKPFERLHPPSSGFEGTGIGLASVRRVIERHGGQIRGDSRVGQGCTFWFSLAPAVGTGTDTGLSGRAPAR